MSEPTRLLPAFWALGADRTDLAAATLVHRAGPIVEPGATFLHRVRPHGPAELGRTLDAAADRLGVPCPRVFLDAATPGWVEAELVARDWTVEAMLFLLLDGRREPARPAAATDPPRPAEDGDWPALRELFRADHEEEDRRAGRPPRPPLRTDAVVAARRALPAPVRYFVLETAGAITGFVAGWPGDGGPGLVEDLYVTPGARGRGAALALLHRAISWARDDGAGPGRAGSGTSRSAPTPPTPRSTSTGASASPRRRCCAPPTPRRRRDPGASTVTGWSAVPSAGDQAVTPDAAAAAPRRRGCGRGPRGPQ